MTRVLMSGASGLIGSALADSLRQDGADLVPLVRSTRKDDGGKKTNISAIAWDPMAPLPPSAVSGFDVVIHLAGESIVGRWTAAKKNAIRESRVRGTENLARALALAEIKPTSFVCACAVGFYGDRGDELLTEQSTPGNGFLAEVAKAWEAATIAASEAGIRTVNLRTGLVLSSKGGALAKMLPPFRLGLGGRLGPGTQWWSWIHIDDFVAAVQHIFGTPTFSGPVNLVAPNAVTNAEFTRDLASALHRPAIFPVPAFALKTLFGSEAAKELFLASVHVLPDKLVNGGYHFRFPDLPSALKNLV